MMPYLSCKDSQCIQSKENSVDRTDAKIYSLSKVKNIFLIDCIFLTNHIFWL